MPQDSGRLTPAAIERRRKLAEALLGRGMQPREIRHPMQGINQLAQAFLGGQQMREVERQERQLEDERRAQFGLPPRNAAMAAALKEPRNQGSATEIPPLVWPEMFRDEPAPNNQRTIPTLGMPPRVAYEVYKANPQAYMQSVLEAQAPSEPIKVGAGDALIDPNTMQPLYTSPSGSDTTDDIQEYEFYAQQERAAGREPMAFDPWMRGQRGASAPSTTLTVGGEKIPESVLKVGIDSSSKADTLANQVNELKTFRDMAGQADTGRLAPVTLPIKQAFQDIGINLGDDVPLMEAIQAQQNQMALRLRNPDSGFGLTGNTSNQDIRFLKDAVAGIEKTPAGNQAILTIMIAKQRREAELAAMKSDYVFDRGTLSGWNDARDEFIKNNSLFTPDEAQFLSGLQGGNGQGNGQGGNTGGWSIRRIE